MFLATGSSLDLMQFLQILSWILIPILLLAVILTVYFHYHKKNSGRVDISAEDKLIKGSPELVGYTRGDGEYICFDHSPLISEYKNRLTLTHARFAALHKDFEKLENRYQALAGFAITQFSNKKESFMKTMHDQLPRQLQAEVEKIAGQYAAEKAELVTKLEQLNQCFKNLEEENNMLQDLVSLRNATELEKAISLHAGRKKTSC